jgi:hypothetical protein
MPLMLIKKQITFKFLLFSILAAVSGCTGTPPRASSLPSERPLEWFDVKVSQGEDPHAYGTNIQLFKHDLSWSGFISEFVGPGFDPPSGRLNDLQFDENAGTISFSAKLSVGVVQLPGSKEWTPAKNLYEFKGRINSDSISGSLIRKRIDDEAVTPQNENVVLKRKDPDANATFVSYEQWNKTWEQILEARGPK